MTGAALQKLAARRALLVATARLQRQTLRSQRARMQALLGVADQAAHAARYALHHPAMIAAAAMSAWLAGRRNLPDLLRSVLAVWQGVQRSE
jgi:hypothetical protein